MHKISRYGLCAALMLGTALIATSASAHHDGSSGGWHDSQSHGGGNNSAPHGSGSSHPSFGHPPSTGNQPSFHPQQPAFHQQSFHQNSGHQNWSQQGGSHQNNSNWVSQQGSSGPAGSGRHNWNRNSNWGSSAPQANWQSSGGHNFSPNSGSGNSGQNNWNGGHRDDRHSGGFGSGSSRFRPQHGNFDWNHHSAHRFSGHDFAHLSGHDRDLWRHGSWRHERHGNRFGWWWFAGDAWYFYDAPVYPYPGYVSDNYYEEEYSPDSGDQYWYYCEDPAGYYPYVQACNGPWEPVDPNSEGADSNGPNSDQYDNGPDDDEGPDDGNGPPPPGH